MIGGMKVPEHKPATVDIGAQTHARLKVYAEVRGKKIGRVAADIIAAHLDRLERAQQARNQQRPDR